MLHSKERCQLKPPPNRLEFVPATDEVKALFKVAFAMEDVKTSWAAKAKDHVIVPMGVAINNRKTLTIPSTGRLHGQCFFSVLDMHPQRACCAPMFAPAVPQTFSVYHHHAIGLVGGRSGAARTIWLIVENRMITQQPSLWCN